MEDVRRALTKTGVGGGSQTVFPSVPAGTSPRSLEALFTSLFFLLLASHPKPNDVIVINNLIIIQGKLTGVLPLFFSNSLSNSK